MTPLIYVFDLSLWCFSFYVLLEEINFFVVVNWSPPDLFLFFFLENNKEYSLCKLMTPTLFVGARVGDERFVWFGGLIHLVPLYLRLLRAGVGVRRSLKLWVRCHLSKRQYSNRKDSFSSGVRKGHQVKFSDYREWPLEVKETWTWKDDTESGEGEDSQEQRYRLGTLSRP